MSQSLENYAPAHQAPVSSPSGRTAGWFWLTASIITILMYWICLRFVSPGYFAPLSPFHVDFYVYGSVVKHSFAELLSRYPRPVTYLGFKILGSAGLKPMMAAGIAVALIDVLLTFWLAIKVLQLDSLWLLLSYPVYTFLLFAHPQFYIEHRHDLPAELSWFFLSISLVAWLYAVESRNMRAAPLLIALVTAILFAFAKETYFISALCIVAGLALTRPAQRLRHLVFLGFLLAVEFTSFEWTNHFNGPFVNVNADPSATYHMSLAPSDVAHTFLFYLDHLVNPWLIPVVLMGFLAACKSRSRFIMAAALVCAGLAAFATVSVLPNHKFEEYAWAGAALFLAPVLLMTQQKFTPLFVTFFSIMAVVGPNSYRTAYDTDGSRWWIAQDMRGTRLARSFDRFKTIPRPARILVTGLDDPGVPWQLEGFTRLQFGDRILWTVAFPPKVDYRLKNPLATFVDGSRVQLSDYDYVAGYRADGSMIGIRPVTSINQAEGLASLVVPALNEHQSLLESARLCLDWGFPQEAERYLEKAQANSPEASSDNDFLQLASELPKDFQKRLEGALPPELVARPELYNRPELTAYPAHIVQPDRSGLGVTELAWNVPKDVKVEIHVNGPNGVLFTSGGKSGRARTDKWVSNGMKFFLQDVTGGKPLTVENTIAAVKVDVE
jgi:hypothetical protein